MAVAQQGDTVRVHYTGSLENGEVFDSSQGRDPLEFQLGAGQVIAGFDHAVVGMQAGEEKRVTIPADEAYGPRSSDYVLKVGRDELPQGIDPVVGQQLRMGQGGREVRVTVAEVEEDAVVLDANHPLAGQDLVFDLELVAII